MKHPQSRTSRAAPWKSYINQAVWAARHVLSFRDEFVTARPQMLRNCFMKHVGEGSQILSFDLASEYSWFVKVFIVSVV